MPLSIVHMQNYGWYPKDSYLRRQRPLAPSAAVRVSPLCLGTMTFGGKKQERYGECPSVNAFAVLDKFYHQGGNFIDTASRCQEGQSEMFVGDCTALRQNRDQIVLATKYTTAYMTHHEDRIQSKYGGNKCQIHEGQRGTIISQTPDLLSQSALHALVGLHNNSSRAHATPLLIWLFAE